MQLKNFKKKEKEKENQQHRVFTPTSEKQGKKKKSISVSSIWDIICTMSPHTGRLKELQSDDCVRNQESGQV